MADILSMKPHNKRARKRARSVPKTRNLSHKTFSRTFNHTKYEKSMMLTNGDMNKSIKSEYVKKIGVKLSKNKSRKLITLEMNKKKLAMFEQKRARNDQFHFLGLTTNSIKYKNGEDKKGKGDNENKNNFFRVRRKRRGGITANMLLSNCKKHKSPYKIFPYKFFPYKFKT